jgi:Interferon-related developmental regulator (IFRD)
VTVCASDDTVVAESVQDLCEQLGTATEYRSHPVPATLRAAAWDCWSLLACLQDDLHLAGQDDVSTGRGLGVLESLMGCLDSGSVELRSAAGQALALIHEARLNLGAAGTVSSAAGGGGGGGGADLGQLSSTARRYLPGSWESSQFEEIMDDVQQRVTELSVESTHHMSKKVKKAQRATFREFMATLVDDEPPEHTVQFRGGSLTLSTWKEIVTLNFVRHCLQSGFQIQMLTNRTLQNMFGADGRLLGSTGAGLSAIEKRLVLSKTSVASKLADKDRRGRRDKRENIKNHFLTADDDDA